MKVLVVHNAYQIRGGEDSVVESEVNLLRAAGHEVHTYSRHNDEITLMSRPSAAFESLWSKQSSREVGNLLCKLEPDVMHVHNTLPLISPSVFWAARRAGVPCVMTLHNFRLLCPQAMFLRDGRVCEDCLGGLPWRSVMRRCYRESSLQSAVLSAGVALHRGIGTYNQVDRFIALSQFARLKFIEGGLPSERIVVKPNFVEDHVTPRMTQQKNRLGGLFVGRLSAEKGVDVLISAADSWPEGTVDVIGHGPLEEDVRASRKLIYQGSMPLHDVMRKMADAAFLIVPSICYENFPRTIAEAFCMGLPVIASRLGGMAEIIEDGVTGLLFEPGHAYDLAAKVKWAQSHPTEMTLMGRAARARYEKYYGSRTNLQQLESIYQSVINFGD
ncbi:glycosyltransferase [Aquabacterium sp.]|uniref:glycosyltransferase n=1 Tax=Aquabacterium sp. TaxID=1872578 RepID=UPI003BB16C30